MRNTGGPKPTQRTRMDDQLYRIIANTKSKKFSSVKVIEYLLSLPSSKPIPKYLGQAIQNPANVDTKIIDPLDQNILFICKAIDRLVRFLKQGKSVSEFTERHLDLALFGTIFEHYENFTYSEVLSTVSKQRRSTISGKSSYLCDYLRTVLAYRCCAVPLI